MGDHQNKIRAFSQRIHLKTMKSVCDAERGADAKALYIDARRKINQLSERDEILRVAADTKAYIRAMYESSSHKGHEDQILYEGIDHVRDMRLWKMSRNN